MSEDYDSPPSVAAVLRRQLARSSGETVVEVSRVEYEAVVDEINPYYRWSVNDGTENILVGTRWGRVVVRPRKTGFR